MKPNEYSQDSAPKSVGQMGNEKKAPSFSPGGQITETIETQTGKLPWVSWVGLAAASYVASATIVATRKRDHHLALLVGSFAPCFLLVGVYNKLVQIEKRMSAEHVVVPPPFVEVPTSTSYLS